MLINLLIPSLADEISYAENLLHALQEASNTTGLNINADETTFNAFKGQGSMKTLCQASLKWVELFWQPNCVHRSKLNPEKEKPSTLSLN